MLEPLPDLERFPWEGTGYVYVSPGPPWDVPPEFQWWLDLAATIAGIDPTLSHLDLGGQNYLDSDPDERAEVLETLIRLHVNDIARRTLKNEFDALHTRVYNQAVIDAKLTARQRNSAQRIAYEKSEDLFKRALADWKRQVAEAESNPGGLGPFEDPELPPEPVAPPMPAYVDVDAIVADPAHVAREVKARMADKLARMRRWRTVIRSTNLAHGEWLRRQVMREVEGLLADVVSEAAFDAPPGEKPSDSDRKNYGDAIADAVLEARARAANVVRDRLGLSPAKKG